MEGVISLSSAAGPFARNENTEIGVAVIIETSQSFVARHDRLPRKRKKNTSTEIALKAVDNW